MGASRVLGSWPTSQILVVRPYELRSCWHQESSRQGNSVLRQAIFLPFSGIAFSLLFANRATSYLLSAQLARWSFVASGVCVFRPMQQSILQNCRNIATERECHRYLEQ